MGHRYPQSLGPIRVLAPIYLQGAGYFCLAVPLAELDTANPFRDSVWGRVLFYRPFLAGPSPSPLFLADHCAATDLFRNVLPLFLEGNELAVTFQIWVVRKWRT